MDQILPPTGIPSQINPLLMRVRIPGESFTLPSGGVFYTNGELAPDVKNGEVHVYPMTGIDELIMKSVDKILNGEAVKEVFGRCIPSILKPGELSAKDIDYLLVAIKKVSYGPTFDITYTHTCENAEQHTYELALDIFLRGAKSLNPTTIKSSYQHVLENKQVVYFKPATYDDVIEVYKTEQIHHAQADDSESHSDMLNRLLTSAAILIDRVDDTSDRAMIVEWLKSLPVQWLQSISEAATRTTDWGVEFNVPIKCIDCGEELVIPTPLNPISFFI
jgi:hypothetical protein